MPHPYSSRAEHMDMEQVKNHHCTAVYSRSQSLLLPRQMGRECLKPSRDVVSGAAGTKLLLRPGDKLKRAHVKAAGTPLLA